MQAHAYYIFAVHNTKKQFQHVFFLYEPLYSTEMRIVVFEHCYALKLKAYYICNLLNSTYHMNMYYTIYTSMFLLFGPSHIYLYYVCKIHTLEKHYIRQHSEYRQIEHSDDCILYLITKRKGRIFDKIDTIEIFQHTLHSIIKYKSFKRSQNRYYPIHVNFGLCDQISAEKTTRTWHSLIIWSVVLKYQLVQL